MERTGFVKMFYPHILFIFICVFDRIRKKIMRNGSRPPDGGQEEGKERAQKQGSHGLLEVLLLVLVGKRRRVAQELVLGAIQYEGLKFFFF